MMMMVLALQEVLSEQRGVSQTLNGRIHVARVLEVVQSQEARLDWSFLFAG